MRHRASGAIRALHVIPAIAERDGGPTVAVDEMTRALAAAGVAVQLATTDADGARAHLDVPLDTPVVRGGVTIRYFRRSLPTSWKPSLGLARWLDANAGSFDVIHVHGMFTFSTVAACRAARRAGVPYVLHPLGTLGAWSLGYRAWKKRPYYSLVERGHLLGAAAVHATSSHEGAAVDALGFGERVRVIPLGVTSPVDGSARPARERVEGQLRALLVARLHPAKAIPVLLEAIAVARDRHGVVVRLTIAGAGEPAYEATLRARSAELHVTELVAFAGHVAGHEKARMFADADVFVLPSHHENFGIAVAEAMAAGLAVVVSDQVGIAPDVVSAAAGIVTPVDADALGGALARLARDPAEWARMGAAGAEFAAGHYSWSSVAQQIIAMYDDIVGAAHASRQPAAAGAAS